MVTEHAIGLALPYSTRAGEEFHVSVFVTPKLEGDAQTEASSGGTTLSDFAVFPQWAKNLQQGLKVELRDQAGPIECSPILDPLDPDAWAALFPGDTPVRANVVPPFQDRPWRTFDARMVHDIGKAIALYTSVTSIVDPPLPSRHPFMRDLVRTLQEFKILTGQGRILFDEVDDERWTELLDREVGEGGDRKGPRNTDQFAQFAGRPLGLYSIIHEARRYYDRPESKSDYRATPDSPPPDPLKPKAPEFHERVAMVGDHPELLRRLGLVVDLVVADPVRLTKSKWLSARLLVTAQTAELTAAAREVRCETTTDGALVTVPVTADWVRGALALGDSDRFAVLDMDADGTALKTEQYLRLLPRLLLRERNREPVNAATPGLRAQGFTVARRAQASVVFDRVGRQHQLEQQYATTTPPPAALQLASEDVARGIRVEVWDSTDPGWRSLHARTTAAEIVGLPQKIDLGEGHGFAQGTPAEETPVPEDKPAPPLNVHEAVFGWEGWSLSVAKPGKRVRNELVTQPDGSKALEEIVEPPPTAVPVDATNPVGFTHTIVPGTLPRLRYGHDYAFRAWLVDLAGNVRPAAGATAGGTADADEPAGGGGATRGAAGASAGGRLGRLGREAIQPVRRITDRAATAARAIDRRLLLRERLAAGLGRVTLPAEVDKTVSESVAAQIGKDAARRTEAAGLGRLGALGESLHRSAVASVTEPAELLPPAATPTLGRAERAALRTELSTVLGRTSLDEALAAGGDALSASVVSRAATVTESVRQALTTSQGAAFGVAATKDREILTAAVAAQLGRGQATIDPGAIAPGVLDALKTITAPRPFLRWDPVPPPTLVARARYSEGESQRVVVIRSGVSQDPATLEVAITAPDAYRDEVAAADPQTAFLAIGQRHLVPPKIGQLQAEYHGAFDELVGDGSAPNLKKALGVALRENGTLYDIDVADIDDPGARTPLPGVAIVHDPGVDAADLVALPIPQGDAPPAGQYVVHDVDELELPYLPDPLARGVSLVFPDATVTPSLPWPFGMEGFTTDYEVDARGWPLVKPYRLTLTDGPTPRADVAGRVIDIALPAGVVQRFHLSSSLAPEALDVLGMWRALPDVLEGIEILREAARDGYLWSLTPKERVLLVHAVPRPIAAPRPVTLVSTRKQDATYAALVGGVHVHGPSTEQVTAEASWTDIVDDLGLAAWESRPARGIAFTTPVTDDERLGVLVSRDSLAVDADWPLDGTIRLHGTRHEFGDTKHRMVDYRLRASTRFREYFPPALLTPPDGAPDWDDGSSTVTDLIRISVPSSARPAPPVVHSVVPLFRWSHDDPDVDPDPDDDMATVQSGQPIAERHTRRAGVRIYLQRPWYSSGEGELLGVLLGSSPAAGPYSLWAQDPIWTGATWPNPHLSAFTLTDLLRITGIDDTWEPGLPVAVESGLPLPTGAGQKSTYKAAVAGYRPQYNPARRLWYVDVALAPNAQTWPFLRLAVARYQPESVAGLELSSPVVSDFVQVPPERTALVSRLDEHEVRVVVSGAAPVRANIDAGVPQTGNDLDAIAQNRVVIASLQKADPELPGDLGWITVDSRPMLVANYDATERLIAWGITLGTSESVPLRRPGPEASPWRVTVEEWERFPGDPALNRIGAAVLPQWEQRLIFADEVYL